MRRPNSLPALLALALAAAGCGRDQPTAGDAGRRVQALGALGAPCGEPCATAAECTRKCGVAACVSSCCVYSALDCSDTNPCTADSCNESVGCVHTPLNAGACDGDGNRCTVGTCSNGTCAEGPPTVCPGETSCKKASTCDPATGACSAPQNKPDATPCERDDDLCTADRCDGAGACQAGDYSATVDVGCGLDPVGSTLTASASKLPVGGNATLTAHPLNLLGRPFPKPVTIACSFGAVGSGSVLGPDTLATVTSPFPGVATCTASSEGQRFEATVGVAFTGVGLVLAHAAARPSIEEGELADLVATLTTGAAGATPGVTLEVTLPEGLSYVEGSARVQGATVTATQDGNRLQLRLPDLPAAPGETRVGYRLAAGSASGGIKPVVARALVGGAPASAEATAELTVGAIYELGGCGCAQGAGPLGLAGFAALALGLRRRGRAGSRPA